MKNLKFRFKIILISFFIPTSFMGFYFLFNKYSKEKEGKSWLKKSNDLKNLVSMSEVLQKIWLEGQTDQLSEDKFVECKKALVANNDVDSSYFRCNPDFMECFLKKVKGKVSYKRSGKNSNIGTVIPYELGGKKHFGQVITRWSNKGKYVPNYSFSLKLISGKTRLVFLMQNTCNEVFLPQRNYSYGTNSRNKETFWDNFNQNIFIDKFQVTFRDIAEWKNAIRLPFEIPSKSIPSDSAFGLSIKEMKNYCSFRGKQLLQAHIWDAATYIPQDIRNNKKRIIRKGPYPWTKKRISFLWKAKNKAGFKFEKKYCKKVFTRDCLSLMPFKRHSRASSSWSGVFQVLGGYPEAMNNPFNYGKNLKLSSFYLGADSPWHELGKRSYWNGFSFDINRLGLQEELNFEKKLKALEKLPSSEIKIAFRCMRKLK